MGFWFFDPRKQSAPAVSLRTEITIGVQRLSFVLLARDDRVVGIQFRAGLVQGRDD